MIIINKAIFCPFSIIYFCFLFFFSFLILFFLIFFFKNMYKYINSFTCFLQKNGIIENNNKYRVKFRNIQDKKTLNKLLYQVLIEQDPKSK